MSRLGFSASDGVPQERDLLAWLESTQPELLSSPSGRR